MRDPCVDALPPVVEPSDLRLMVGAPGHLAGEYPPPLRADGLVHLQVPPDISDRDDLVEPGMGDEDHVGVGAGGDGRERTARTGREQVGTITDAQLTQIAELKMPDLNANDIDGAKKQVAGTARSMGIKVS